MVCCDLCGITCHGDCLGDFDGGVQDGKTSEHSSSRKWVCGVCEDKRAPTSTRPPNEGKNGKPARVVRPTAKTEGNKVKVKWERPSHKCVLCVHSGGAMYKVSADKLFHDNCVSDGIIAPGEEGWVHDICKIAVKPRAALNMFEICAICGDEGSGSAPLVGLKSLSKCCVDGCNVLFHPMCAVAGNTIMGEAAARTVRAERLRRVEEKMEREKKEREKKKEEEEEVREKEERGKARTRGLRARSARRSARTRCLRARSARTRCLRARHVSRPAQNALFSCLVAGNFAAQTAWLANGRKTGATQVRRAPAAFPCGFRLYSD